MKGTSSKGDGEKDGTHHRTTSLTKGRTKWNGKTSRVNKQTTLRKKRPKMRLGRAEKEGGSDLFHPKTAQGKPMIDIANTDKGEERIERVHVLKNKNN